MKRTPMIREASASRASAGRGVVTPYRPESAPGLVPHAETLDLCSCGECRAERMRAGGWTMRLLNTPFVPDAALWRELARRSR